MKKILIKIIKLYQKFISPLKRNSCCIFEPSCSNYAIQSIQKHGVIKGMILATYRILRCNPFNKNGGIDFVPEEFTIFRRKK